MIIGSDLDKRGYRNAATIYAKIDQFDFVLIGLHLKAGRDTADREWRNRQLAVISGYVQGVLAAGEMDVLVIGDYNMIPGQDVENFETLNADVSLRFVSSQALAGQGSHIGSNVIAQLTSEPVPTRHPARHSTTTDLSVRPRVAVAAVR